MNSNRRSSARESDATVFSHPVRLTSRRIAWVAQWRVFTRIKEFAGALHLPLRSFRVTGSDESRRHFSTETENEPWNGKRKRKSAETKGCGRERTGPTDQPPRMCLENRLEWELCGSRCRVLLTQEFRDPSAGVEIGRAGCCRGLRRYSIM